MGLWSSFKKGIDAILYIRPKKWVSWDFVRVNTEKNIDIIKSAYSIEKSARIESFSQAVHRHGLTAKDIEVLGKRYLRYSYIFFTLGLGIIFYGIQGFILQQYLQATGSLCLSAFVFSLAFRYNFWAFQIKKKN